MAPKGSFISAAKDFFGLKPATHEREAQKVLEFGGEVKELEPQDRLDLATGLHGIDRLTDAGLAKEQAKSPKLTACPSYA